MNNIKRSWPSSQLTLLRLSHVPLDIQFVVDALGEPGDENATEWLGFCGMLSQG